MHEHPLSPTKIAMHMHLDEVVLLEVGDHLLDALVHARLVRLDVDLRFRWGLVGCRDASELCSMRG